MSLLGNLAHAHALQSVVGADLVDAYTVEEDTALQSPSKFKVTGHAAEVNDVVMIIEGTFTGLTSRIVAVDTDYITLQQPLPRALPSGTNIRVFRTAAENSTWTSLTLDSTGVLLKTGRAKLLGVIMTNHAAAARYLKIYNRLTVNPAAHVPDFRVSLAAGGHSPLIVPPDSGAPFDVGLFVRGVTLPADTDTTAWTANDVTLSIIFR